MASERVALMIFLLSLFTLSSSRPDNAGIAVYWGRNLQEGDLVSACDTGNYKIVLLAFLNNFGAGRTSAWDFAAHCDNGAAEKCTELESEIKYCQVLHSENITYSVECSFEFIVFVFVVYWL